MRRLFTATIRAAETQDEGSRGNQPPFDFVCFAPLFRLCACVYRNGERFLLLPLDIDKQRTKIQAHKGNFSLCLCDATFCRGGRGQGIDNKQTKKVSGKDGKILN